MVHIYNNISNLTKELSKLYRVLLTPLNKGNFKRVAYPHDVVIYVFDTSVETSYNTLYEFLKLCMWCDEYDIKLVLIDYDIPVTAKSYKYNYVNKFQEILEHNIMMLKNYLIIKCGVHEEHFEYSIQKDELISIIDMYLMNDVSGIYHI